MALSASQIDSLFVKVSIPYSIAAGVLQKNIILLTSPYQSTLKSGIYYSSDPPPRIKKGEHVADDSKILMLKSWEDTANRKPLPHNF